MISMQFVKKYQYKDLFLVGFYLSFIIVTTIATIIDLFLANYFDAVLEQSFVLVGVASFIYFLKSGNSILATRIIVWIGNILALLFVYIYNFNLTIIFTVLVPIGAFVLLTPRESLKNMSLYYLLLALLIFYASMHSENHPILHNPDNATIYFIAILFTIAFGLFYNYTIEESYNRLKVSNEEKAILLREIHHRVRNNLNIISSLVNLQKKMCDIQSLEQMNMIQSRIESIAILHEMLYANEQNLENVDMEQYIIKLFYFLQKLHAKNSLQQNIEINNIILSLPIAVDIGLILNELLTNTFKYAADEDEDLSIAIVVELVKNRLTIHYEDSGKKLLNSPFNIEEKKGLGLKLVQLTVKKLDGTIEIITDEKFVIEIVLTIS